MITTGKENARRVERQLMRKLGDGSRVLPTRGAPFSCRPAKGGECGGSRRPGRPRTRACRRPSANLGQWWRRPARH
eukprot:5835545-Pyramimonas_sp.AAC.1